MIYLSSDSHWYHSNIITFCNRPYKSVEEMNEKLIYNWNNIITPEDTIYYIGDFSLAFRPVETITPRLNGIKKLVPGNHDWCHSYHKKGKRDLKGWIKKYEDYGWEVLPEQTELYYNGQKFNLCHFPSVNDSAFDDKYESWRPYIPEDEILLCGHVHEKWMQKDNCFNVGVDVHDYKPISIQQVIELMNK
jgi:calcineurin-like phosphoesterase family protein